MLNESGTIYFVFKLMDRGHSIQEIDHAMKKMVGNYWKEVPVSIWRRRLVAEGYMPNNVKLSVDDLEALIKGTTRIDGL